MVLCGAGAIWRHTYIQELKMPLYDYECKNGHRSEHIMPIDDKAPVPCPECSSPAIRVVSHGRAPTVVYKGDWFKTKGRY